MIVGSIEIFDQPGFSKTTLSFDCCVQKDQKV